MSVSQDELERLLSHIQDLETRVAELERVEQADIPGTGVPTSTAQGDMLISDSDPKWALLAVGNGRDMLMVNIGGTSPEWVPVTWANLVAGGASDLVHNHSASGEGGQLDWDSVWSDAVHSHQSAAEGGQLDHGLALTGLGDNDHPQYPEKAQTETITGQWVYENHVYIRSAKALTFSAATLNHGQIVHDGAHFFFKGIVHGGDIRIQAEDVGGVNRAVLYGDPDAGVQLYYAGSEKFETVSGGIDITGSIQVSTAHSARVYRSSVQSIPNTAWTAISFSAEQHDTGDNNWVIGAPTKLTAQRDGVYLVSFNAPWALNATGARYTRMLLNGVAVMFRLQYPFATSNTCHMHGVAVMELSASDFIEVQVYQSSGAALDLDTASIDPWASITRLP